MSGKRKIVLAVMFITLLFTGLTFFEEWRFVRGSGIRIWFFNVGQGEATLIRSHDGRTILIDGGPDGSVLEGLSKALPWWTKKIDVILVTHFHADHFVGLFGVVNRYDVGEVWLTGEIPSTRTGRKFLQLVRNKKIKERLVAFGDRYEFGEKESLEVIFPENTLGGSLTFGKNPTSIVSRFWCGDESVLFTGDITFKEERWLLENGSLKKETILKVAHHGSANSTSDEFLNTVAPDNAVISSGLGNRYGHPAPRVVAELLSRGTLIHRTDREGNVMFVCDNGKFKKVSVGKWWKL